MALQLNPEDISSQELLKDAKKTLFGLGETPDTTETLEVGEEPALLTVEPRTWQSVYLFKVDACAIVLEGKLT